MPGYGYVMIIKYLHDWILLVHFMLHLLLGLFL